MTSKAETRAKIEGWTSDADAARDAITKWWHERLDLARERLDGVQAQRPRQRREDDRVLHARECEAWSRELLTACAEIVTETRYHARENERVLRMTHREKRLVRTPILDADLLDATAVAAEGMRDAYLPCLDATRDLVAPVAGRARAVLAASLARIQGDALERARLAAERARLEDEARLVPPVAEAVRLCARCGKRDRHFDDLCKRCANEAGLRPRGPVR